MVEAIEVDEDRSSADAVGSVASRHTKASLMARSGPPGGHAEPA
jgi:hypothetical protein